MLAIAMCTASTIACLTTLPHLQLEAVQRLGHFIDQLVFINWVDVCTILCCHHLLAKLAW